MSNVLAIVQMFELQDSMNSKVHPEWRTHIWPHLGAPARWTRAIRDELIAEIIPKIGWKWWKATDSMELGLQTKLELVDIWHFLLSELLRVSALDVVSQATLESTIESHLESHIDLGRRDAQDVSHLRKYILDIIEVYIATTLDYDRKCTLYSINDGIHASRDVQDLYQLIDGFGVLMGLFGMTIVELNNWYLAKNALNVFRQQNGYKSGEYVKLWDNENEDNYFLEVIVTDVLSVNGDEVLTFDDIMKELDNMYKFNLKKYHGKG